MKRIFGSIVLVYFCGQAYGCKQYWDNTCKRDEDCCSGVCHKEEKWKFGVCKPEDVNYPPKFNKCAEDLQNNCVVNEHCCSGICDKSVDQKFGECRPNECQSPASEKLEIICFAPSNKTTPCNKPLRTNSRAIIRCKTPIYWQVKQPEYTEITCRYGKWDRPLVDDFCQTDCGRSVSNIARPSGTASDFGEFPWNGGLYQFNPSTKEYQHFCGATLISPKVLISAAHCITTDNKEERKINFKDLSKLKVAVGKYYRNINASEDTFAQIKDIASVEIAADYKGYWSLYAGDVAFIVLKERVKYSWAVLPICVDVGENNFERNQLVEGAEGKVVGWGLTSKGIPSQKLLLIEVPYVLKDECHDKISFEWLHYVTNEKVCAGYEKSRSKVCNGNSGGGLVFMDPTKEKYYLRGIVSLGPSCHLEGFALFTRLSSYKELVERYLRL